MKNLMIALTIALSLGQVVLAGESVNTSTQSMYDSIMDSGWVPDIAIFKRNPITGKNELVDTVLYYCESKVKQLRKELFQAKIVLDVVVGNRPVPMIGFSRMKPDEPKRKFTSKAHFLCDKEVERLEDELYYTRRLTEFMGGDGGISVTQPPVLKRNSPSTH